MRRLLAAAALCAAFPLSSGAQAAAQPVFSAKGFFAGAAINGSAIRAEDFEDDTDSGVGASLLLGWGFTPQLAIFAEGAAASISTDGDGWTLSHFDIGVRYYFAGGERRFVPFVEGAFTGRAASQDDVTLIDEDGEEVTGDVELSGTGFTIGGGFNWYFTPTLALTTNLKWTAGEFDTVKFGNVSVDGLDADATTARVNIGLTWHPRGGR